VFIEGKHVGGLFTGTPDGLYPGLATLKESGELQNMLGIGDEKECIEVARPGERAVSR